MGNNQTALTAGLAELTSKEEMHLKIHKGAVTEVRMEAVLTGVLHNSIDF